ncbi:uncharacterized protein LOC100214567 [Hydra vulgaris]|uniref:uncharacterized protein LOC100214567 n=1 Tax=Hydra vulgaris TaxID=6087 RepID=UPI0002B424FE|nr:uncharacterized protein LOC100214567 [Hydra vulgaris]
MFYPPILLMQFIFVYIAVITPESFDSNDTTTEFSSGIENDSSDDKMESNGPLHITKSLFPKTGVESGDEYDKWQKRTEYFVTALKTILKISENLPVVGTFLNIFNNLVDAIPGKSVWGQISSEVKSAIEKKITQNNHYNLVSHIAFLKTITRRKHQITVDNFNQMINIKGHFFPQTYWNLFKFVPEKFGSAIVGYITYLNTVFLELIKNSEKHQVVKTQDDYNKQLHTLRSEVIMAAKALHRKRYENLEGIDQSSRWKARSNKATLTYRDPFENKVYEELLSNVKNNIFNVIMKSTNRILMDVMVEKVNLFFEPDLCESNCPPKITEQDISFEYEESCYGTTLERNSRSCALPCDYYNRMFSWINDNDWCPLRNGVQLNNIFFGKYEDCVKNNWESESNNCMRLTRVNDVPERKKLDKLYRKLKMKNKS